MDKLSLERNETYQELNGAFGAIIHECDQNLKDIVGTDEYEHLIFELEERIK